MGKMSKKHIAAIITAAVIAVLALVYAGAKIYAGNVAEQGVKEIVSAASGYFDISYKKVSVNLFAMDLTISDAVFAPAGSPPGSDDEIKIKKLIIHEIDRNQGVPNYLSFSARGIDLNLYEMENTIKAMGYEDRLLYDLAVNYKYFPDKKEFAVNKIALGSDKAGEINISMYFTDIDLSPEMIMYTFFSYPAIVLKEGEISYTDKSLAGRVMDFEAQFNSSNADDYKLQLNQEIDTRIQEEIAGALELTLQCDQHVDD